MNMHRCREGEEIGIEWMPYPYVITYCRMCRHWMRYIPLDDVPPAWKELVSEMIEYAKKHGRG